MAAATSARLATRMKINAGDRYYDKPAAAALFCGTLAGINSDNEAEACAAAQGFTTAGVVLGRTGRDGVDPAAGESTRISEGVFGPFAQSGTAITAGDIGEPAFVVDNQTVAISGTHAAGIIVDVTSDGVWIQTGLAICGAIDARDLA